MPKGVSNLTNYLARVGSYKIFAPKYELLYCCIDMIINHLDSIASYTV